MRLQAEILDLEKLQAEPTDWTSWPRFFGHKAFCHGCFDLLTLGHVTHLQQAKQLVRPPTICDCGNLFVSVTQDCFVGKGPGRPVNPQRQRMEMLAALRCVDFVLLNPGPTAVELIRLLRPRYYVKGGEFRNNLTPALKLEKEAIEAVGGELVFTDGVEIHTTEMVERIRA